MLTEKPWVRSIGVEQKDWAFRLEPENINNRRNAKNAFLRVGLVFENVKKCALSVFIGEKFYSN